MRKNEGRQTGSREVAIKQGEDPFRSRNSTYLIRRDFRWFFSSRVSFRSFIDGTGIVRSVRSTVVGQSVREWAHNNAYTLIFLSVMFIITWLILIIGLLCQM